MGIERLCGALKCYSKQFRLINIQQTLRVFQNATTWSKSSPGGVSSRGMQVCVGGLGGKIFAVSSGQQAARRGLCTSAQPSRDVTLFEHDRTGFFRLLTAFCSGQFLFWTYLAHFAYTGLKDTRVTTEQGRKKAASSTALAGMWSFEMNLGSSTWRYGFTLGCVAIGAGIFGLGVLFCRRSVSQVVLHQGGRMVTVSTQSPLGAGRGRRITVPLSQVACHAHRQESPSFIPLKVKGHKFYFLLDNEGTVKNAKLFDVTVGAYRPL